MSERTPTKPDRPAIPVSLYAMACAVAVERAVLALAPPPLVTAWLSVMVVLVTAIVCVVARLRSDDVPGLVRVPVLICAVVVVALASSGVEVARGLSFERSMTSRAPSAWTFLVTSDATETSYGYRCCARAVLVGEPSATVWLTSGDELFVGELVTCVGRYVPNDGAYGIQARQRGIWGTVRVIRVMSRSGTTGPLSVVRDVREAVLSTLLERVTPARAVIAGSVLGDRSAMRQLGLDETFSAAGVSHLVAVSGTHIALLAAMLSAVLVRTPLGPRVRAMVLLLATAAYVVLCGTPASATRAWAMSCVAFGSEVLGRRSHALSSASLVALVLALAAPGLCGDLGFLLSVVSVCSICLMGRYLSYAVASALAPLASRVRLPCRLRRTLQGVGAAACDVVGVTLAAQAATSPLTASVFGEVSLVSPLANMLMAPVLPPLLGLGVVAGSLSWAPPVAQAVLWAADALGAVPIAGLSALARLPLASLPVTQGDVLPTALGPVLLVALLVWWPDVKARLVVPGASVCAAVLVVALVSWRWFAPPRVCVLDVGQGDAILVQDGGAVVLVDAGPDDSVVAALARNHVLHLDAIILTHLHDDHYGGVLSLAGRMGCGRVIVAEGVAEHIDGELADAVGRMGATVSELSIGDVVCVGGFSLDMVWPEGEVDGSDNSHSMELVVCFDDGRRSLSGLLTGDAERDETAACVARGAVGDVDFLKVGHHGSEVSIDETTARVLDPEVSVASAGEGNSFGHPRQECVDALVDAGSVFLCTIDCGDVELRPGVDGVRVLCQKGYHPR